LRRSFVSESGTCFVNAYGPADGYALTTSRESGSVRDVAWKNGIVSFERKVPSGFVSRITRRWPFAVTPETCVA
jgi:hypothetical protein